MELITCKCNCYQSPAKESFFWSISFNIFQHVYSSHSSHIFLLVIVWRICLKTRTIEGLGHSQLMVLLDCFWLIWVRFATFFACGSQSWPNAVFNYHFQGSCTMKLNSTTEMMVGQSVFHGLYVNVEKLFNVDI